MLICNEKEKKEAEASDYKLLLLLLDKTWCFHKIKTKIKVKTHRSIDIYTNICSSRNTRIYK